MKKYAYQVSITSPATKFAAEKHWLVSLDNDPLANISGSVGTNTRNYARYYGYRFYSRAIGNVNLLDRKNIKCQKQLRESLMVLKNNVSEGFWRDGYKPKFLTKQIKCNGIVYILKAEPYERKFTQIKFHSFDFVK